MRYIHYVLEDYYGYRKKSRTLCWPGIDGGIARVGRGYNTGVFSLF
jgi:hypothetical protein